MTLDEEECWARLGLARHGTLATVHPTRGVDAVPVVFALADGRIVVPVDTVKPKRHTSLTRLANVGADPRCVLLVDHWSDDWSELWWVRVHADAAAAEATPELVARLAERYPQYAEAGAVAAALVLTPSGVAGWSARANTRDMGEGAG